MKHIYFLCSPNLGILDSWLPAIYKLRTDNKVILILPKEYLIQGFRRGNALTRIAYKVFDDVIFPSSFGLFHQAKFNPKLISRYSENKVKKAIYKYRIKLNNIFLLKPIKWILDCFLFFYERTYKDSFFNFKDPLPDNSLLLYDFSEENKKYVQSFIFLFRFSKKYSICHAIQLGTEAKYSLEIQNKPTVFAENALSAKNYSNYYNINRENIVVTGVLKYSDYWIKKIHKNSNLEEWDNFVLLISRPSSSYFPLHLKENYLQQIQDYIINKLGYKVIIKTHPKELLSFNSYYDTFDIENYGKSWKFSYEHPLSVGLNAKFAISFYSSVVLDMSVIGIPCIEYLNYDFVSPDHDLNELKKYRNLGLSIGVNNQEEFFSSVNKIVKSKTRVLDDQLSSFDKLNLIDNKSITKIVEKINSDFNKT